MAETPPIPTRLAHRPTVAGLVAPHITITSGDGRHILGAVHHARQLACITGRRCQIDGEPLTHPAVAFVRQADLDRGYTAEPAMHPECARYSAQACPMVNGQQTHYRSTPHNVDSLTCPDPDCNCRGWVDTDQQERRAGQPAEHYYAMWIRNYRVAVNGNNEVIGLAWDPEDVLRIRPLTADAAPPHFPETEWQRGEREADEDIAAGRLTRYDSDEDFLAGLDKLSAEADAKQRKGQDDR